MKLQQQHRVLPFLNQYGAIVLLAILLAGNAAFTQGFISINVIWNLVTQGFVTIIVSLGMMLAISSGGIDLSVGSVMPVAAMITAKSLNLGVVPAVLLGVLAAIAVGCFNGVMISVCKIQPFIVTLSMYMAARGLAQLTNKSMVYNFTNDAFNSLSRYKLGGIVPIQIVIIPIFILIMYVIVKKCTVGRYIQTIGDNCTAARLSGVSIVTTTIFVYAASAMLAGFAGIFETARVGAADPNTLGHNAELDAIASVVLGGTPMSGGKINFSGTIFAALVMQVIVITANMNNISAQFAYIVKAVIILVAVILQQRDSLKR